MCAETFMMCGSSSQ